MSAPTVTRCWRVAATTDEAAELIAMLDAYGGVSIARGERTARWAELLVEELEAPRSSIAILMQAYDAVLVLGTGQGVRL